MEFPQVDLPVDMIAWTEVTEDILNIYKQSCRLKACIFALCIEGSITVSINLMDTEIKQGISLPCFPELSYSFTNKGKVCLDSWVSSHCLNGVNLIQSTLSSFSNILEYPVLAVNPTVASYFKDYFALWARITTGPYPPDTKTGSKHIEHAPQRHRQNVLPPSADAKMGIRAGKRKYAANWCSSSSKTIPANAARNSMPTNWASPCNTSAPP